VTSRAAFAVVLGAMWCLWAPPCSAQQMRSQEGLLIAVRTLAHNDRTLKLFTEVSDTSTLRRDYIRCDGNGMNCSIAGHQQVFVIEVKRLRGDSATVDITTHVSSRNAAGNEAIIDDATLI